MDTVRRLIKNLPVIQQLVVECDKLHRELSAITSELSELKQALPALSASTKEKLFVPLGHFYSPIQSLDYITQHHSDIFRTLSRDIPGIDLREKAQLELLKSLKLYYDEIPFRPAKSENLRYFFENPAYSYSDAIFLYCMIRHTKPKRIIEVGSGYSSCVTLDTNEIHFDNSIEITFIEPFPDLLLSLMKGADKQHTKLVPSNFQEVDVEIFANLEANDILFIDSTHVSKVGSDVNYIFFEVPAQTKARHFCSPFMIFFFL